MSGQSESNSKESIMKWLHEEVGEGENGIVIYPNVQTFRQIYTRYAKEQLAKQEEEEEEIKKIIVKAMVNNQSQESYLSQLFTKQPTV